LTIPDPRCTHRLGRMADAELLGELCAKRHRVCPFYFVVCALDAVDQQSSNHSRPIHAGRFKNTPIFQQNNARSSHQCRQRAKLDPGGGSYVPLNCDSSPKVDFEGIALTLRARDSVPRCVQTIRSRGIIAGTDDRCEGAMLLASGTSAPCQFL
jgi:hypothetical protein